jgi:hypothetical protein
MHRWTTARVVAALVVGVILSVVVDSAVEKPHPVTGTLVEFHAGEFLAIVNDQFEPHPMTLSERTTYESERSHVVDPMTIEPGMHATVWYRNVGERRLVVDKVRVLDDSKSQRGGGRR